MVTRAYTVAFEGVDARLVEVQCALSTGLPAFSVVGLPDKAVSEARERVRSAINALGLALPPKRITINLSPADLPKEGSHFDLPIAMALMAAMDVLPAETVAGNVAMGELSLSGDLIRVVGALPAAVAAGAADMGLICPAAVGGEAAWVDSVPVIAPKTLLDLMNHVTGRTVLPPAAPKKVEDDGTPEDLLDVKGQERAKRALEVAVAGRHHLLMVGPPGSGKSMLARCLPNLMPPLSPQEVLESSMVQSIAGTLDKGAISYSRPFISPHHTASVPAIVGGGAKAKPGEISLAHHGVLFLDELPEFPRQVLETLRQPLETGDVMVSRANAHVRYPCKIMLVAAANPCRCGHLAEPSLACARVPHCGSDYLGRISGPLMDRFDLRIEVPTVPVADLASMPTGEPSKDVAARVAAARRRQSARYDDVPHVMVNADADGALLTETATPDDEGQALLLKAADKHKLSARGYHRVLRVARTIADLEEEDTVCRHHIAEALAYRLSYMP